MRPVAPDPELISWLWTIDGQLWAKANIRGVAHGGGQLAEIKNDHECADENGWCYVRDSNPLSIRYDAQIFKDIRNYGMSGLPKE